jgi:hypothetical protein
MRFSRSLWPLGLIAEYHLQAGLTADVMALMVHVFSGDHLWRRLRLSLSQRSFGMDLRIRHEQGATLKPEVM